MEKYDFSDQQQDYGYGGYDDFSYSSGSPVTAALKGILGAVIGAIPGTLLWILLGKLGFVAAICGALVALGIVIGYSKMDPTDETSTGVKAAVCIVVFVIALCIAEMIVWTWKMSDAFQEYLPTFRSTVISEFIAEYPDFSYDEVADMFTEDMANEMIKEHFGVEKGTFGECFANFGTLLNRLEMKGKFWLSLGESLLFGMLGGFYLIAKSGKNEF